MHFSIDTKTPSWLRRSAAKILPIFNDEYPITWAVAHPIEISYDVIERFLSTTYSI